VLKTFVFRRRRRGARQFQEVELLLTGIVVIVVCWWFSFDFIVSKKGFEWVSQQFPVYLGRFSLNVICLVWFFFCRASCKQQRRDEVLDCSKTVFGVVGFKKRSNQGVGELGEREICGKWRSDSNSLDQHFQRTGG